MNHRIVYRIGAGEDICIPGDAKIVFQVDGGGEIEVSLRGGEVRVCTVDTLVIKPVAANAVDLYTTWR